MKMENNMKKGSIGGIENFDRKIKTRDQKK